MMKKISLTLAMVLGGANLLIAAGLQDLKVTANNALAADPAGAIKDAGVVPESAAVDYAELNGSGSVFQAESTWTGSSDSFGALKQLGVRKDAEEKAIAKCQAQGLLGCVAIGSTLGACGGSMGDFGIYSCSATGMAQARTSPQ